MEMVAALAAAVLRARAPTVAAPRARRFVQALDLVIGIGQFALRRDQILFSLIKLSLDLVELAGADLDCPRAAWPIRIPGFESSDPSPEAP